MATPQGLPTVFAARHRHALAARTIRAGQCLAGTAVKVSRSQPGGEQYLALQALARKTGQGFEQLSVLYALEGFLVSPPHHLDEWQGQAVLSRPAPCETPS